MASPSTITAQSFLEMNYEKDVPILDIYGDGTIGEILSQNGYKNVDLFLANNNNNNNEDIANVLEAKKSLYRNVLQGTLEPDVKLPFTRRTYEVIILAGVFKPENIQVQSIEQLLPIVNSGWFWFHFFNYFFKIQNIWFFFVSWYFKR